MPFLLLPFRPNADPSAAKNFIRTYFRHGEGPSSELTGSDLQREARLLEPLVSGRYKYMFLNITLTWFRLCAVSSNGVGVAYQVASWAGPRMTCSDQENEVCTPLMKKKISLLTTLCRGKHGKECFRYLHPHRC